METFETSDNHSIAYCLLGFLCAYYRHYYPLEYLTSFLNNAANDDDICNGTTYANKIGIQITMPKWGVSKGDYFFDKDKNVIAKGLTSIKFMSAKMAEELYQLATSKNYDSFMDVLFDINSQSSVDSRQLDILIKLDFFSDFGNQRELLRINEMFNKFKKGEARQIKKADVDGTELGPIVERHAVGVTKSGAISKSYTLLDVHAILIEIEDKIKSLHMDDLNDITKVRNFYDAMGYIGYVSGVEADRPKLYILDIKPLCRKKDNKQFGYSVFTKSIGSGKESRFTVFNHVYNKDPIQKDDIIRCRGYTRDGEYFTLTAYDKVF